MSRKPTATDAQLILQLYDLRREAEIRKARKWWTVNFWPNTAEDFMKVADGAGNPGKRLVPSGRRLLGHGGVAGRPRNHPSRPVSRRRLQRRNVFHLRQNPAPVEGIAREDEKPGSVQERRERDHELKGRTGTAEDWSARASRQGEKRWRRAQKQAKRLFNQTQLPAVSSRFSD